MGAGERQGIGSHSILDAGMRAAALPWREEPLREGIAQSNRGEAMSASQGNVRHLGLREGQRESMRCREYSLGVVNGPMEHEQVEIVLRRGEDGTCEVKLILQSWGEGIGWYPQKTIPLPPSQIDPLQRALEKAKRVTRRQEPPQGQGGGAMLTLPSLPPGEDR